MNLTMACVWKIILLNIFIVSGRSNVMKGYFWHISDLHWDPSYDVGSNSASKCASSGGRPTPNAGRFGDYSCDSPWTLINSTLSAMRGILPDPDFIIWTGDDTPHVPDEQLGVEPVLRIIGNLTHIIKTTFPNTKVYSAMGNHDYHPKNQMPPEKNNIYEQTANLWHDWLHAASKETFKIGGYYTEKLLNQTGFRVVVLNTNLYYDQNKLTENIKDPADQFSWADKVLQDAAKNNEKVYIIGHVPPGFFEKKRDKAWFRKEFNKRYIDLIQKHSAIIQGQFFGHHHTDSIRMFYSSKGSPISAMFLAPGVTPWITTLPGVIDGGNNPGIRMFEYDTKTLLIKDIITYYMNLTYSNVVHERWEKEYRLTEAFRVPDASPASMHRVMERISSDKCYLQKYYEFNSVNYDLTECHADCRVDHVCAMREVDFEAYEKCVVKEGGSFTAPVLFTLLLSLMLSLLCFN
ncbi:acid sphingomyelinase-like phosphodiesterase 3b [Sinocyclocheilus rhinocerous]|uniref:Acid sphingomyelinase-like phosphodiesterase n=1 Tax=Sinocyclocheilus rhinocerous TaxID=307959 RepID=A0A673LY25_9TELE|nr:PREDICTED: acid sphingomyelinase-like phosphodiesterase 3b [Sinocyclocheilus rhinocerous]